jgi:DNA-binding MarR family transcriptional regulator
MSGIFTPKVGPPTDLYQILRYVLFHDVVNDDLGLICLKARCVNVEKSLADYAGADVGSDRSLDVGLGMLLRETNIAFNRALRTELGAHDITFGQFQHLHQLWKEDGISQAELSKRIGIARAESTGVIDSLEQGSLIRRKRDPGDGRRLMVFLSPKGRALQPLLWDCAKNVNRQARDGLSVAETAQLFDLLDRVRLNLRR